MNHNFSDFDFVIVGSGFFGLTIAYKVATETNRKVLVIEKREHIGGNSHSETFSNSGIEVHKYGSHLFHTSSLEVWNFINQFSTFNSYVHEVKTMYMGEFYDIPINLHTLSQFFRKPFTPTDANELFQSKRDSNPSKKATSFEERAIQTVGVELYEAFYKSYTKKQWQTDPSLLPADTFTRIPIRLDFNSRYFDDIYQGLPTLGYHKIFQKMIDNKNIEVLTNVDFFDLDFSRREGQVLIFTGPVDRYFKFKYGMLNWRTLDFDWSIEDTKDYQGNSVINYPEEKFPFTRIHEFKHLHPERVDVFNTEKTVIAKEYSRFADYGDEPFYPINSTTDRIILQKYRDLARLEKGVFFGGRLGRYQYLDMHMAIAAALRLFDGLQET